jgi:hypothetical protein
VQLEISSEKSIEDTDAYYQVDFANKYLHIHQIIPSCTQEEVMFSVRPECYLGIIICDVMLDHEAIIISGAK